MQETPEGDIRRGRVAGKARGALLPGEWAPGAVHPARSEGDRIWGVREVQWPEEGYPERWAARSGGRRLREDEIRGHASLRSWDSGVSE